MTTVGSAAKTKHRTTIAGKVASWRLIGHSIEILSMICTSATFPAYRLRQDGTHELLPLCQPGTIAFAPEAYPDLSAARELCEEHGDLWDAVRHDLWEALLSHGGHATDDVPRDRIPPTSISAESDTQTRYFGNGV